MTVQLTTAYLVLSAFLPGHYLSRVYTKYAIKISYMTRIGLLIALPSSARVPSFSDSPLYPCQLRNRISRLNPSTVTLHIICRDLASRVLSGNKKTSNLKLG
jgi:hypothetical protein